MTYISIIERQGIEKGLEEGIEQGRTATLYKLLQLKFSDAAADYEQRLLQANAAELNLWIERVLFAETIDAVFKE